MTIIGVLVLVCVILFALWLAKSFLPQPWQTPVLVILVLIALVALIVTFFPTVATMRVGR